MTHQDSLDSYDYQERSMRTPCREPNTNVVIDNTMTPRSDLLAEGVEDIDFEILPDDEDDENDVDDENEENEGPLDDLQGVDESSSEEEVEEDVSDDKSPDRLDEIQPTDVQRQEKDRSGSFDSFPLSRLRSNQEREKSPSEAKSPESSHHRQRTLTGFFSASSHKQPSSPLRVQKRQAPTISGNSVDGAIAASSSGDNVDSAAIDEKLKPGQRLTTLIRSTMGAFKDPGNKSSEPSNSLGIAAGEEAGEIAGVVDEQESSSDESSYDEEEQWLEEESQIFEDDIDQVIDCSTLTSLPNSFLNLPPDIYDYLDSDLVKNIQNQDVSTFAWEHHLFVKGLLQLLAERDLIGVEDDIYSSNNISKMGVLRKKHAKSGWRVKYVEVRKGNLTYYADKQDEKRRTVHLRKRTCTCKGEDLVFELIVDGGRRLLWMAKSEKECQGWIKAINQAMIGETDDIRDGPLDLTSYQSAIDDFLSVMTSMKDASTRQEYLTAMNTLLYRQTSSSALRVPMTWLRQNVIKEEMTKEIPGTPHESIKYTIRDFWESLCNTSIVINGYLVEADSTYSGERVIGALSRCILEFDKVESEQDFEQAFNSLKRANEEAESFISEVEAVSYSRSILSGALQSNRRGDMLSAVDELFSNNKVACVKLESSEPLHVDVSFAGDDFSEDGLDSSNHPTDFVGWVETKSKKSKNWKMRYFVVSEGVLSYFERADPRPYRLRGQVVLRDVKVSQLAGNILSIGEKDKERLLRFEDRGELLKWKGTIDKDRDMIDEIIVKDNELEMAEESQIGTDAMDREPFEDASSPPSSSAIRRVRSSSEDVNGGKPLKGVRDAGGKFLKNVKLHANRAAAEGMKRARNATGAGMKSIRTGAGMFMRGVRRPTPEMFLSSTRNLKAKIEKREPTVQAVVEMNNLFKVVSRTNVNDGEEGEELL